MTWQAIADTAVTGLATVLAAWVTAQVSSLKTRVEKLERSE